LARGWEQAVEELFARLWPDDAAGSEHRAAIEDGAAAEPRRIVDFGGCYYEILGLGRGAADREIEAAYRHLARVLHPDKGGDALSLARLKHVTEVLLKDRAVYDTHGREAFAATWPKGNEGEEGGARPMAAGERICLAPVNVEAVMKFCSLAASRELMHGAHSFAELCFAQVERATKIPGRPGMWTCDAFAPARRPEELGLRAGMEVKYDSEHTGELNGLSVFSFPKIVRLLVRSKTPCRIVDIANSHYVMAQELAASEGIPVPLIAQLVRDREEVIAAVRESLGLGRDAVKKLLLSVLYGAKVEHDLPFLRDLRREVEAFAWELARRHPAKIAKLQDLCQKAGGGGLGFWPDLSRMR
jgi:hypothetical protein